MCMKRQSFSVYLKVTFILKDRPEFYPASLLCCVVSIFWTSLNLEKNLTQSLDISAIITAWLESPVSSKWESRRCLHCSMNVGIVNYALASYEVMYGQCSLWSTLEPFLA